MEIVNVNIAEEIILKIYKSFVSDFENIKNYEFTKYVIDSELSDCATDLGKKIKYRIVANYIGRGIESNEPIFEIVSMEIKFG